MNKGGPSTQRLRVRDLLLPALGVGIAYTAMFHLPISRSLTERTVKHTKLSEALATGRIDAEGQAKALKVANDSHREVTGQLRAFKSPDSRLTLLEPTATLACEPRSAATTSRVAMLAETLATFSRHQLQCLESQPAAEPERSTRIKLIGRFTDMHSAIDELQTNLPCVSIVSLQMESSAEDNGLHQWIAIVQHQGP